MEGKKERGARDTQGEEGNGLCDGWELRFAILLYSYFEVLIEVLYQGAMVIFTHLKFQWKIILQISTDYTKIWEENKRQREMLQL